MLLQVGVSDLRSRILLVSFGSSAHWSLKEKALPVLFHSVQEYNSEWPVGFEDTCTRILH